MTGPTAGGSSGREEGLAGRSSGQSSAGEAGSRGGSSGRDGGLAGRSSAREEGFAARFVERVAADGVLAPGDRVVLGLSGGLDSTVLLHLLLFTPGLLPLEIHAAHFDHRMRPDSRKDRLWVEGLCRAWQVRLHWEEAGSGLDSEEEARESRYDFLLRVKDRENAAWILTGHHAGDQAETMLFRIFRGTGLRGLAGIPRERSPGLYRPLLPFSRAELSGYARLRGIRCRDDPTNLNLDVPRNFLRHRILPGLEHGPFPGATESLLRLARLARENEEAWESLSPVLLGKIWMEDERGDFIVRSGLLAYHPAVRARLLRAIFQKSGIELDEAGTRAVIEFTSSRSSGSSLSLPGGALLVREFDRFRLRLAEDSEGAEAGDSQVLVDAGAGRGSLVLGGHRLEVVWGPEMPGDCQAIAEAPISGVEFPLRLRGWKAGDKISLSYGTKKLKKLFAEAKIPVERRGSIPVLVDAGGRVLWVAGLASSIQMSANSKSGTLFIGIRNADKD